MFRQPLSAVAAVIALLSLAACTGGGSNVDTSSPPTGSPTDQSATSTLPAPSSSTSDAESTTPALTGFGGAQPAVDAYAAYQNLSNNGLRKPASFSATALNKVSAGQARQVLAYAISDELRQGKAYRGTPWTLRVKIKSASLNGSLPAVVMTDCPKPNSTWVEHVARTGAIVPKVQPKVAPPYLATIKAFQPNRKTWVITSYKLDGSKTCSA